MSPNNTLLTLPILLVVLALAAHLFIAQIPTIEVCVGITVLVAVLVVAAAYFLLRKRRKCPNAPT